MKDELIYLAIPYSQFPELSFAIANEITAKLLSKGKCVFNPISHTHHVAPYLDKEHRFSNDFWMGADLPILRICSQIMVVVIGSRGHEFIDNSHGCQGEIKEAQKLGIPMSYYWYDHEIKTV